MSSLRHYESNSMRIWGKEVVLFQIRIKTYKIKCLNKRQSSPSTFANIILMGTYKIRGGGKLQESPNHNKSKSSILGFFLSEAQRNYKKKKRTSTLTEASKKIKRKRTC